MDELHKKLNSVTAVSRVGLVGDTSTIYLIEVNWYVEMTVCCQELQHSRFMCMSKTKHPNQN